MTLADVMRAIEQHRFSAEVNLAGSKAFRRGLRNHDLFRELAEHAKEPHARIEILKRITFLSSRELDKRYENRFDAALSAYLTVLGETAEPEVVTEAASTAASAPNCWWTVGISRELQMRAIATGHVRSAPVVYFDANVLVSGVRWKETPAESFRQWFAERKTDTSLERWSRVLRVLNAAQLTSQRGGSVVGQPEDDQPVVSLNFRRRQKNRHRPPHRRVLIRHGHRSPNHHTEAQMA
jgi:hypothetical protein